MSQVESKLAAFFISITESMDNTLQGLAELADRVFALAKLYPPSSNVPSGTTLNRSAVVHYPVFQMGDPEFTPVEAILHEDQLEQPRRVVVNFQTRTAVYEVLGDYLPIEPEQIDRALEGIKIYIRDDWERNGVKNPVDWSDFLQRLESGGVLPSKSHADPHPTSVHKQCPLCDRWTSRCTSCYAIMCSNRECAVSQVIPFQSCSQHPSKAMCLPCLETEKIEWRLGQCPRCELWFCFSELTWCVGRTNGSLYNSPDTGEHSVKPIGCSSCIGVRDHCANFSCWSKSNTHWLIAGVCESCSPEGGLRCTCKRSWVCDACRTSRTDKHLVECPRCTKVYCLDGCNYIACCFMCGRTSVCDDCFEEDWNIAMDVDVVVLKTKCGNPVCRRQVCAECLEVTQCADCCDPTCNYCSLQASGGLGDGRLCSPCYHKRFEAMFEQL